MVATVTGPAAVALSATVAVLAEGASLMSYQIATREVPAQMVAAIRRHIGQEDLASFIGSGIQTIMGALPGLGARAVGMPFVMYHAFGESGVDVELAVPVDRATSAIPPVRLRMLPGTTVAWTTHVGSYDGLGAAYAALSAWLESRGQRQEGAFRERYLDGPGDGVAPGMYRTEIEIPVAPAAVPAADEAALAARPA